MGDTINIDWARAQTPPDPATTYANAFQAGLGLAKSAGMQAGRQRLRERSAGRHHAHGDDRSRP